MLHCIGCYSGSQRQAGLGKENPRLSTVQNTLEVQKFFSRFLFLKLFYNIFFNQKSLEVFNTKAKPFVVMSSRTDAGVHALSTSAHFDLHHKEPGKYFFPESVMNRMNLYFHQNNLPIRFVNCLIILFILFSKFLYF